MFKTTLALVMSIGLFSCAPSGYGPSPAGISQAQASPSVRAMKSSPSVADSVSSVVGKRSSSPASPARPGLATGWGKEKESSITNQSFVRASSKPAGTDSLYYNDKEGVKAMANYRRNTSPTKVSANKLIEWGVKGRFGYYKTIQDYRKGQRIVVGKPNAPYTIVIKNRAKCPIEVVTSVDGLDVFDGKKASFSKRGYIIAPGATLEVDGFRTSYDTVASFKFSSVANSYANMRHGDTRNVGVIGVAVFTPKGMDPWKWMPNEVNRRRDAQPFATAP